jgi:hypothetical protein
MLITILSGGAASVNGINGRNGVQKDDRMGTYQKLVQQLFATSENELIGLQLKIPSIHFDKAVTTLVEMKSMDEIQSYLKMDSSRLKVYLKKDPTDDTDNTIANGLCLIDTLRRIVQSYKKEDIQRADKGLLLTFLQDMITKTEELAKDTHYTHITNRNYVEELINMLIRNLEKLREMQMFISNENTGLFLPFPHDDLTRMLYPEVPRILIREVEGQDSIVEFNELVSINNITKSNYFCHEEIIDILEKEIIYVFKLKGQHYWDSQDRKQWQNQATQDIQEAMVKLSAKVLKLNEDFSFSSSSSSSSSSSTSSSSSSSSSTSTSTSTSTSNPSVSKKAKIL